MMKYVYIYGITVVTKVEKDIIAITAASLSWYTSDDNFQDLQNLHYCSYRQCHIVFDVALTNNIQYQSVRWN